MPEEKVYDCDFFADRALIEDAPARLLEIVRDAPPIFWTPRNRADRAHIAFGGGVHRCLGAQLARIEMQPLYEEMPRACRHSDSIRLNQCAFTEAMSGVRKSLTSCGEPVDS